MGEPAVINLSGLLQKRLIKTAAEYAILFCLALIFWYLVVGSVLNGVIVNDRRIVREADAYAVKADQDVKRSIALASAQFGESSAPPLAGLELSYDPLASFVNPYAAALASAGLPGETTGLGGVQPPVGRPPVAERPQAVVAGIGGNGARTFAIISQGGSSKVYRVGDLLDGWRIQSIANGDVIVAKGQKGFVLHWKGD